MSARKDPNLLKCPNCQQEGFLLGGLKSHVCKALNPKRRLNPGEIAAAINAWRAAQMTPANRIGLKYGRR